MWTCSRPSPWLLMRFATPSAAEHARLACRGHGICPLKDAVIVHGVMWSTVPSLRITCSTTTDANSAAREAASAADWESSTSRHSTCITVHARSRRWLAVFAPVPDSSMSKELTTPPPPPPPVPPWRRAIENGSSSSSPSSPGSENSTLSPSSPKSPPSSCSAARSASGRYGRSRASAARQSSAAASSWSSGWGASKPSPPSPLGVTAAADATAGVEFCRAIFAFCACWLSR
mmetsp:Transcript_47955/g.148006  ORF Transcript_47955/g.148006 Transcript_47955/m.148006 type:complete len:232 (-) Transcript_47955:382-1077(-)